MVIERAVCIQLLSVYESLLHNLTVYLSAILQKGVQKKKLLQKGVFNGMVILERNK